MSHSVRRAASVPSLSDIDENDIEAERTRNNYPRKSSMPVIPTPFAKTASRRKSLVEWTKLTFGHEKKLASTKEESEQRGSQNDLFIPEENDIETKISKLRTRNNNPRKTSMPVIQTPFPKTASRRTSLVDWPKLGLGHEKKLASTKEESEQRGSQDDLYIPEEYLEASLSPGSLREEIRQLRTMNKSKDSFLGFKFDDIDMSFITYHPEVKPAISNRSLSN